MEYPFREYKCEVCGKTFVQAIEHIFNEERRGKVHHICGYNCNCIFNRKHPKVKGSRWSKNESEFGKNT